MKQVMSTVDGALLASASACMSPTAARGSSSSPLPPLSAPSSVTTGADRYMQEGEGERERDGDDFDSLQEQIVAVDKWDQDENPSDQPPIAMMDPFGEDAWVWGDAWRDGKKVGEAYIYM